MNTASNWLYVFLIYHLKNIWPLKVILNVYSFDISSFLSDEDVDEDHDGDDDDLSLFFRRLNITCPYRFHLWTFPYLYK